MAFGSTFAHEQGSADDVWRERAVGASVGCDRATFIAERDNQWVGLATGLARQDDPKNAGPLLVGMFVDGTARRLSRWRRIDRSRRSLGTGVRSCPPHPLGYLRK
jgi:hypothetical protein